MNWTIAISTALRFVGWPAFLMGLALTLTSFFTWARENENEKTSQEERQRTIDGFKLSAALCLLGVIMVAVGRGLIG